MAKKATKKAEAKKAVKKTAGKKATAKPEKVAKKETKAPITKVAETAPEVKTTPTPTPVPDFKADVAKTVAKPATTITVVNTDRQRRVIATTETPASANDVAELERIYQSTYKRANVINLRPAYELEAWIKRLNPNADVLVLRPNKGTKIQAAFNVTVGDSTRRFPDVGFWSTSG